MQLSRYCDVISARKLNFSAIFDCARTAGRLHVGGAPELAAVLVLVDTDSGV